MPAFSFALTELCFRNFLSLWLNTIATHRYRRDIVDEFEIMWTRNPFSVSTDQSRMNVDVIHGFLARSYWSPNIPREFVERAMRNSICFALFHEDEQIGFARVVTDRASFAYLADVFVLEPWRGQGLSKFLMECVRSHTELQNLRRWLLATRDAHGLYAQFGFKAIEHPERLMEIVDFSIYQRLRNEPEG